VNLVFCDVNCSGGGGLSQVASHTSVNVYLLPTAMPTQHSPATQPHSPPMSTEPQKLCRRPLPKRRERRSTIAFNSTQAASTLHRPTKPSRTRTARDQTSAARLGTPSVPAPASAHSGAHSRSSHARARSSPSSSGPTFCSTSAWYSSSHARSAGASSCASTSLRWIGHCGRARQRRANRKQKQRKTAERTIVSRSILKKPFPPKSCGVRAAPTTTTLSMRMPQRPSA
jgi:hypothetical protein